MIHLDRAEALRYLGYAGQQIDGDLEQRFICAVEACENELVPRSLHKVFSVDQTQSNATQVVLEGCNLVLEGCDIVRHLCGASQVALMACTLGEACERELRRRTAISPTDALLYDAAASALVEAAANAEEARVVQAAMQQDLYANFRFSPGYGDFPLSVQPDFLRVLDAAKRIGLVCTTDYLLVPRKSVTAVVGLFAGEPLGGAARSSCSICSLKEHCPLRSQGRTCHG